MMPVPPLPLRGMLEQFIWMCSAINRLSLNGIRMKLNVGCMINRNEYIIPFFFFITEMFSYVSFAFPLLSLQFTFVWSLM